MTGIVAWKNGVRLSAFRASTPITHPLFLGHGAGRVIRTPQISDLCKHRLIHQTVSNAYPSAMPAQRSLVLFTASAASPCSVRSDSPRREEGSPKASGLVPRPFHGCHTLHTRFGAGCHLVFHQRKPCGGSRDAISTVLLARQGSADRGASSRDTHLDRNSGEHDDLDGERLTSSLV